MGAHVRAARHGVIARVTFVVVAVLAFAADRVAKLLVEANLELGERVGVVGDLLELRRVHNDGIAFGLFSGLGPVIVAATLVLAAVSLGAALVPAWRAASVDPTEALRL